MTQVAAAVQSADESAPSKPRPLPTDLSKAIVDSTLQRNPDATQFGGWGYARALYLLGQYFVYRRTRDPEYIAYIRAWVDQHIDASGKLDRDINALDFIFPATLTPILYQETHEERYKLAAAEFRRRFDTYPRTSDGGFWHATVASRQHQLWLDGIFMGMEFLVRYGQVFGDQKYANEEAARQIVVYGTHLQDAKTGLLFHAYDESGTQPWADPKTHHSAEFWGRAMGWYGMAIVDLLDVLPKDQPQRKMILRILRKYVAALGRYQDPATGLWYQVVDKGSVPGNWLETSCSSMYTYTIDVAVKRGYVGRKYKEVADRGYQGVLSKVSAGDDGLLNVGDISEGTNVSDAAYYFGRKRNLNDFHGLGAFLLMNEEYTTGVSTMQQMGKR
jgi:unsaturated rhamnogalacturonyl hydrolase